MCRCSRVDVTCAQCQWSVQSIINKPKVVYTPQGPSPQATSHTKEQSTYYILLYAHHCVCVLILLVLSTDHDAHPTRRIPYTLLHRASGPAERAPPGSRSTHLPHPCVVKGTREPRQGAHGTNTAPKRRQLFRAPAPVKAPAPRRRPLATLTLTPALTAALLRGQAYGPYAQPWCAGKLPDKGSNRIAINAAITHVAIAWQSYSSPTLVRR